MRRPVAILFVLALTATSALVPVTSPNTFDTMLGFTAAVFWFFFLLTGLAFFMLRYLDGDLYRPFRVPLYPFIPLIFCGWCAYMTIGVIIEEPMVSLATVNLADFVSGQIVGVLLGMAFRWWAFRRFVFPHADVRTATPVAATGL